MELPIARDHCLPSPAGPLGLWCPSANPQGHLSVPGSCSVFPGHSLVWDACLDGRKILTQREGMGLFSG